MTPYDIAITLHSGVGAKTVARLIDHFGSAEAVYAASVNDLVEAGLRRDVAVRVHSGETMPKAETEMRRIAHVGVGCVAATDALYPDLLREAVDRPHVLYYMGSVEAPSKRTLSVVGTRNSSQYGAVAIDRMVEYLAARVPDLCVVSGLAFGTDSNAHRAALRHGVATVAVIPAHLPDVVPSENTDLARDILAHGGAIVSESDSFVGLTRNNFVSRNRIIAALSAGTLVVESKIGGGSMTTADFAYGYNRTLMAVPGRITDTVAQGTNSLLVGRRAAAVCSGEDIVREMGWDIESAEVGVLQFDKPEASEVAKPLLRFIPEGDPVSIDELIERSGIDKGTLSQLLVDLELDGIVRRLPGDSYTRI